MVNHKYTKEQKEFFKSCKGISYKQGCELFEQTFNQSITLQAYKRQIREAGGNGVDSRFQKGHVISRKNKYIAYNKMDNGTIVFRNRGRGLWEYMIKIDDKWKPLKRIVWEEHNGKIPEGMQVWFKDGNSKNLEIDNLILLSKSESFNYFTKRYYELPVELRETGILLSKLNCKLKNEN